MHRLLIALGIEVCLLGTVFPGDQPDVAPCPERRAVEAIVRDQLPAFTLPESVGNAVDACSKVATGDFNGDGSTDYAAVLTEKVAPRTYSDDSPRFTSYVFIFLATPLPYAQHQAVLLLGHSSAPKRVTLKTVAATTKGATDQLAIKNASYSRTVYQWAPTGFVVRSHAAD